MQRELPPKVASRLLNLVFDALQLVPKDGQHNLVQKVSKAVQDSIDELSGENSHGNNTPSHISHSPRAVHEASSPPRDPSAVRAVEASIDSGETHQAQPSPSEAPTATIILGHLMGSCGSPSPYSANIPPALEASIAGVQPTTLEGEMIGPGGNFSHEESYMDPGIPAATDIPNVATDFSPTVPDEPAFDFDQFHDVNFYEPDMQLLEQLGPGTTYDDFTTGTSEEHHPGQ